MTKKLGPGSEIDAFCTKCKMDLLHRIIAMVGTNPKKVECRTCGSAHNYRRPASLAAEPKVKRAGTGTRTGGGSVSARALAAAKAENDREKTWEKLVSGRAVTDFKPYRPTVIFTIGELIRHTKFGDGYVTRVVDKGKFEAMFRDGQKTLAHNLVAAS